MFRLAESLTVGVAVFFDGMAPEHSPCVFHCGERSGVVLEKASKGMIAGQRLLPPGIGETGIEPYLLTIEPGRKLAGHFFHHKGEEAGYLLKGRLALWVDGQLQEAEAGDFIYLRQEMPEQWENNGDEAAELLWLKVR